MTGTFLYTKISLMGLKPTWFRDDGFYGSSELL